MKYKHHQLKNIHWLPLWWEDPAGVRVVINSIGVYDDFMEYETARMKELHGATDKDIPNIN